MQNTNVEKRLEILERTPGAQPWRTWQIWDNENEGEPITKEAKPRAVVEAEIAAWLLENPNGHVITINWVDDWKAVEPEPEE